MLEESLRGIRLGIVGTGVMAEAMLAGTARSADLSCRRRCAPHASACGSSRWCAGRDSHHVQRVPSRSRDSATVDTDVILLGRQAADARRRDGRASAVVARRTVLVISIIAGATTTAIGQGLAHPAVVRCMPNTPAQIGADHRLHDQPSRSTRSRKARTQTMLDRARAGVSRFTMSDQVAMATAVSGTGPTYSSCSSSVR